MYKLAHIFMLIIYFILFYFILWRYWLSERSLQAHHTKHRWPPREHLPLSATLRFNSSLQCGRCFGYLHPHNPEDEM